MKYPWHITLILIGIILLAWITYVLVQPVPRSLNECLGDGEIGDMYIEFCKNKTK